MNLLVIHRIALKAIAQNKMRSGLTALGIIIGIGAVICTIAVAEGATTQIRAAIASAGANMIWVEAGSRNVGGVQTGRGGAAKRLSVADLQAIKAQVPLVTYISPLVDTGLQVVYGNQNWRTQVRGVTPDYLGIRRWQVTQGTMFTEQDIQVAAMVCVLGQSVVSMLFKDEDPIGQTIRVRNLPCRVVGVLALKGASATGQDQDDTFLMPYTTVQKKIKGQTWLDDIQCSAISEAVVAAAEDQISSLLRERHQIRPGQPDDFNLRHPTEIAETIAASARVMEVLMAGVALVSLLVGGIGIMNIMLVSVTERTREIGIRMSVGARGRDVRAQFLIEALTLSVIGGALGTLAGVAGSRAISDVLHWSTRVSLNAILLAFGFSAAIGIFFGFYPASKAARLDPIDALRFE